jgi:hypothetical protein
VKLVRTNPGGVRRIVLHLEAQLTEAPGNMSEQFDPWDFRKDALTRRTSDLGNQLAEALKSVPGIGAVQFTTYTVKFDLGDVFDELNITVHVLEILFDALQADTLNIMYGGTVSQSSRSNLYDMMKQFYR